MRRLLILSTVLALYACKHPLAIQGEGDIVDLNSTANNNAYGCTLEEFRGGSARCENDVQGDYFVNYQAVPREGWRFSHWDGSCGHTTIARNCAFEVAAAWVTYWDANFAEFAIPALTAVFVPENSGEDSDGDGLSDTLENTLGTSPMTSDSDCDFIDDSAEVGDIANPTDTDSDGIIDALESLKADTDGDGTNDQADGSHALQLGCLAFSPSVIRNDNSQSSIVTVRISGEGISRVELKAFWPQYSIYVDGTEVIDNAIELFDDGSNGDAIAGDGIYSRGNFRSDSFQDLDVLELHEVLVTTGSGTQSLDLFNVISSALTLGIINQTLVQTPTPVNDEIQIVSNAIGIADSASMLGMQQFFGNDVWEGNQAATKKLIETFGDNFDFAILFVDRDTPGAPFGKNQAIRNAVTGLGMGIYDSGADWGSAALLKSVMARNFGSNGPTLHELAHNWAAFLDPSLGFGSLIGSGHWGLVGTGVGQLGGFDASTLEDLGNGNYRVGSHGLFANGGDSVNYSMLELYTMGLASTGEIGDIPVPQNPSNRSCDNTYCTFSATGINTVTITDIISADGARSPAFGASQTAFKTAFVLLTEQPASPEALAFVNEQAKLLALPQGVSNWLKSFADATLGRGTMDTSISPP